MKFERELSKPLYAVTVNKGLWVSLSHPIYDFLNRKNFSCFVINEHHAYQHRIVTNCINNILDLVLHKLLAIRPIPNTHKLSKWNRVQWQLLQYAFPNDRRGPHLAPQYYCFPCRPK